MENVEHKETYKKWKTLVNMSRGELEKFYNSQEGKDAGLSSQEASEQGISSGRESARWIMKMKDTNVSDWTPSMWRWAKKQISFISRMSGNKGPLYDDKGNKTRKHTSLLIWGNNPEKYSEGGLIAPNRKPSNLTPEQYRLVRTSAFKNWFGDWEFNPSEASKVVDENGEPLVVYHGVKSNWFLERFVFDATKEGSNTNRKRRELGGIYFISKREEAVRYAGKTNGIRNKVFSFFLNFRNPQKLDAQGEIFSNFLTKHPEFRSSTEDFIFKNTYDNLYHSTDILADIFVTNNPNQIKLADGSNTTFDVGNPDVRYEDGGRIKPIKKSILNNFQSGSSLDFYDNKIFVVGDDTRDLLILNKNFEELNRVSLFESEDRRIAKDLKADLETSTIIEYNGSPSMLMLGSGSKDNKSFGYIINLDTLEVTEKFKYDIFINRLKDEYGIADVNIEGSACVSDYFLLSNRGNKTNPDNLLIVTENNFWEKQSRVNISLSRILLPNKDAGVSEIYYEIDSDTLFFTASIEHTANNYDDGKIGDSFIGYILNFSSKLYKDTVTPDLFINLTEVDSSFNKQKIEGICIEDNTGGNYVINLVSDNDNDESIIFKIELKKPVRGGSLNSFQQLANKYNNG